MTNMTQVRGWATSHLLIAMVIAAAVGFGLGLLLS